MAEPEKKKLYEVSMALGAWSYKTLQIQATSPESARELALRATPHAIRVDWVIDLEDEFDG